MRGVAFVVASRFLKCAVILSLMPTDTLAQRMPDSDVGCTHVHGLDQTDQVRKPIAAGPNAIQDTRKLYIERFGEPTFEKQLPDGVLLVWVTTDGKSAQNVAIQIVQGTLHITCATTF